MNVNSLAFPLLMFGVFAYLVWHFRQRWNAAGNEVAAMDHREEFTKRNFAAIQSHPQFQELMSRVETLFPLASGNTDSNGHKLLYATFLGPRGEAILVESSAEATWLMAYFAGPSGKKQVSLNLATQEISQQELNFMQSPYVLPMWAR